MADSINILGVTLILLAYVLLQIRKVHADSIIYNLMNFIGGLLSSIGAFMIDVMPFVVLEGVWALVALLALIRSAKKQILPE